MTQILNWIRLSLFLSHKKVKERSKGKTKVGVVEVCGFYTTDGKKNLSF